MTEARPSVASPSESARAVESLIKETRRQLAANGAEPAMGHESRAPDGDPMFGSIVGLAAEIARSSGIESQLRALIEEAPAAIFLKDRELRYVFANRRAAALAGVADPETLIGHTDEAFLPAASAAEIMASDRKILDGGPPLDDEAVNHLPTGDAILHAQVFAIPDQTGRLAWLAGVVSDVTARRRAEAALAEQAQLERVRAGVIASMRSIPTTADHAEVAAAADRTLVEVGGFIGAGILTFAGRSEIRLLHSEIRADSGPGDLSTVIVPEVVRRTRRRIRSGPFVDAWTAGGADGLDLGRLGIRSTACLPLEWRGEILGMLAVASGAEPDQLERRVRDLSEIADSIAIRLGPRLAAHARMHVDRRAVRRIIHRRAFRPVFQPIVDLMSREVVGYEGLTRFADGAPPDQTFAMARRAGLGIELEIATLTAILEASGPLPANRYLSLNVSPDVILAGTALRGLLRDAGFNVVLEITEHDQVDDYPALLAAIAELGDHVTIAVDDAGSGFASLRHIVELRPAYVKLDRGLIAGIDRDVARQAMVAGLREFAARLDVTLVAEGVEREAERATLLGLDLRRAQGYLFGRPAPVDETLAALRASHDVESPSSAPAA
ncbi:MAG TPA: EAL domain-containing protein [Candidatus Limnocylindrales bacterium]|nr:EAL domain-containing protein [Candidatus Limnocylindrales bacterium]